MNHFLLIEYENVSNFRDDTLSSFSDEWCDRILDINRKKESLLARLLLDKICLKVLGKKISEAELRKTNLGMPYLKNYPDLKISISHSHGHVWVAASNCPIGIDFEKIDIHLKNDLKEAFNKNDWNSISEDYKEIFKYFSLKESYSKMTGTGFTENPAEIRLIDLNKNIFFKFFENTSSSFILTLISKDFEPNNVVNFSFLENIDSIFN